MGAVPGEPKSALSLLKSGFWVAVVPGKSLLDGLELDTKLDPRIQVERMRA